MGKEAAANAMATAEAAKASAAKAKTAQRDAEWAKYQKENAAQTAHKTKAEEDAEMAKKAQSSLLASFCCGVDKNAPTIAWEAEMAARRAARKARWAAEAVEYDAAQAQDAAKIAQQVA